MSQNYNRGFARIGFTLTTKKNAQKKISRSAGSWGKVKISKCADFDGDFEKT